MGLPSYENILIIKNQMVQDSSFVFTCKSLSGLAVKICHCYSVIR